ncbi:MULTISPECIES: DUF4089 domain-containing protein [Rhodomicrobium]|uniref:DUF4089 domain-containing protein n=1 Tax=Rhodomicrobium TaxID=1068 RepID=UPI000B4AADEE|nr:MULTISPECIES: DUF4089 domain-containing protein [Rhodomicrobium]
MSEIDDKGLDAMIEAGAKALDLPIDASRLPAIRANLKVTLGHGALVAGFALPDESEPAPIFRA